MRTYDVQSEMLYGTAGSQRFQIRAVSGGGRGSKLRPEGDENLRSWSYWTKEDEKKGVRGGIIPPGFYVCHYVANHSKFHECIFLEQTITSLVGPAPASPIGIALHDRDGFYIHARGPKGSDGCIVVINESERKLLNKAVKNNSASLRVVNPYLPDQNYPSLIRTSVA